MKGIVKYSVQWKVFIIEHNSWKKKEDLENAKEVVTKFEERINTEVRKQERLDLEEEINFRRMKLLEKYMMKLLYRWEDRKFEKEYLKKLERNR